MATDKPGAPNENIVQNHLNIVKRILMFKQLDIGIFYPLKIFHLLGFPSWKSRRGRQERNFTTNVPKIVDLRSSSEKIFSENWRWLPLTSKGIMFVVAVV